MSWFFGKKKQQKESPVESTEDLTSTNIDNEFEKIEISPPYPVPPNTQDGTPPSSSNLYPLINKVTDYPTYPTDTTKNNQSDTIQYFNGVPFKLSKNLERNDLELEKFRVNEILSFIQRIDELNLDYDFTHEKSVIAEMNSTSDE
ncbi:PREDICTED: uncharacterized protein LOC107071227 [Polistes dominula]|uniref:Uncharacterized protein LOC107071227 n=1 Tax=Polistes dominula TaxID=743375 RepID=A0ABM1IZ72_POLDO|nr:PREDICTED: uncharacterized protein LOC107071227 [Polistes dominula]